nr:PREDICTED: uncharacterized protein LOC109037093 [Bemisia tabaci]
MRQWAAFLILPCLVLTSLLPGTESEDEQFNLDPRYLIPFSHLFYSPLSSAIALRFINDIMHSESPKLCDMIGYNNNTNYNESSGIYDIVCLKNGTIEPVAFIGIQPARFESTARELTQFEVAREYSRQLHGMDWKQRVRHYENLIPVLSIIVSQFEAGRMDRVLKHSKMLDTWSHENLYADFMITSLYLDKCRERVRRDDIIRNDLDKWCHFFLFGGSYLVGEIPTWTKDDQVMRLAFWMLNPRQYSEHELKVQAKSIDAAEKDYAAYKEAVKQGRWKVGKLK